MRTLLAVALALALAATLVGCASPGPAVEATPPPAGPAALRFPREPGLHAIALEVDGQPARGLLGVPAVPPSALVVVAKGIFTDLDETPAFIEPLRLQGALVLAMEFRGPDETWKVRTGVADTVAGTLAVRSEFPVERSILWGFSMGGQVAALAAAAAPAGTYTHLVDGAGYADFADAWAEQVMLRPLVEAEAGGTPATAPEAYRELSPVHHAAAIAAAGMQRVYLVHGAADTVVSPHQSQRMYLALGDAGQPTTYLSVLTGPGAYVCAPFVFACAAELPVGPANHEASWQGVLQRLLGDLVAGAPGPTAAQEHLLVDGVTGKSVAMPA